MSDTPNAKANVDDRGAGGGWGVLAAAAILVLATLGVYWNSRDVPFLFDDTWGVIDNPSICHLGQIGEVLAPPTTTAATGRPMLNLSFALNYAWNGLSVRGYHVVNLLIHICAGLVLLGIVRRTLRLPSLISRYGEVALPLALCAALLWTLHPLQTEAVTYISQRAESLMGLFYLLTLYGFIRSVRPNLTEGNQGSELKRRSLQSSARTPISWGAGWLVLSVVACFLGMATKQVMVTAPVLVLLYDRAFVGSSFRSALATRRWYYASMASAWLLLGFLMHRSPLKAVGVGFQMEVGSLTYALTELRVVVDYFRLAIWPYPLAFDYGTEIYITSPLMAAPYALLVAVALAGVVIAWRRSPMTGFLGCCFFLILAPTSTVVPITGQPMAESRMYLPLAAVVVAAVMLSFTLIRRRAFIVVMLVVLLFGVLTARRNNDYRSEMSIWEDTVARRPHSSRGHTNFGLALAAIPGRLTDAIAHYEEALRISPNYPEAHNNLASALAKTPDGTAGAIAHLEDALRIDPTYAEAHNNLGNVFVSMPGKLAEAVACYEEALRLKPNYALAHNNLAGALSKIPGRSSDAIAHYEEALRLKPDYADAHYNFGNLLKVMPGRLPDAIAHYEEALRFKPDLIETRNNLANALAEMPGRLPDAIEHYEEALRTHPDDAEIHANYANTLAKMPGRLRDAIAHYEAALRLKPDFDQAHNHYASILVQMPGRMPDAIAHYEAALRANPSYAEAHSNLASVLTTMPGHSADTIAHAREALRLRPDYPEAHYILANALAQMPGQLPEAITHYEAAVRLKPDFMEAHNNLAAYYAGMGRVEDAIEQLEIAAQLAPNLPAIRDNLEKLKAKRKQQAQE